MAVYTVHAPASYGVDVRTTSDRLVFVRDGFYFWAFVFSFFWLIWHRLWLALFRLRRDLGCVGHRASLVWS